MNGTDPSFETVLKRNPRERLKKAKHPLRILDELPDLIRRGYEAVAEDDIVRLQWHGFYHDRPKSGGFMLRIKLPGGVVSPQGLRTVGELSRRFGRGYGEITTRQDLQLHSLSLESFPSVLDGLRGAGLSSLGGCGDVVRNITGCPLSGISKLELFDVGGVITDLGNFFDGSAEYSDLPRKHKITVTACPEQCSLPEIHCQAYIAVEREVGGSKEQGFVLRLGGGLSTVPRIARSLGVFVPIGEILPVARAVIDVWKNDPQFRRSFATSRLKFAIDKLGVEEFRSRLEVRLGRRLADAPPMPRATAETPHLGVIEQRDPGIHAVGFPVVAGRLSGEQMIQIADLATTFADPERTDVRFTRQQNLVVTHVPDRCLDLFCRGMETVGFKLEESMTARAIACTGKPFCNFAISETKDRLADILAHLQSVFGDRAAELHIHLDGCPHACGHHWIGDVGLMGTTTRLASGEKRECFDVILGGGRGNFAAVGRSVARRVPAESVKFRLEVLLRVFLDLEQEPDGRFRSHRFQAFCQERPEYVQSILSTESERENQA